jgi:hypothetical protein
LGVADFLDGGCDDGGVVLGVAKLEVHTAADVLELKHGASPGGTGDGDVNRVGAKFGMAGDESVTAAEQDGGVTMVKRLNVEDGRWREIVEKNSALDFRSDDGIVNFVREVGVRGEHGESLGDRVMGFG